MNSSTDSMLPGYAPPDGSSIAAWRPIATAAAAVAIPVLCGYATERLTSGRPSDTGANVGGPSGTSRRFLHGAGLQTLLAAAAAGSWLAAQGSHLSSGGRGRWGFGGSSRPSTWSLGALNPFAGLGSGSRWQPRSWGFGHPGSAGAASTGGALHGATRWHYAMAVLALPIVWLALCRSASLRLLTACAGVLATVEAANQLYRGTPVEAAAVPASVLLWLAPTLLAAAGLASMVVKPQPTARVASGSLRVPVAPRPLQRTATPAQQTLKSLSLARISVFGGGSAEKSPPDKGHFVVQPTGSFQQPLRSPLGNMLARVSMMLGQASGPAPPPLPPKPWLDDAHRSIATHYFSEPGPLGLKVRGPNYLSDKKKVEAEALEAELLSVDLVDVAPTFHIARHLPSALHCTAPFMFIMQVMVPGSPKLSLTVIWALAYDPRSDFAPQTPFVRSLRQFLDGDDAERSNIFKLIPRVEKGSWIVKQAVGQNTPVLLGKKLTTKYFTGPNYIEVDVDVGSSTSASSVVGLVAGAVKNLVIDMAVVLQANDVESLPETLLGTMRLEHLDLSAAPWLDTDNNCIVPKDREAPSCAARPPATPAKGGWLRRHQSTPLLQDLAGRKDSGSSQRSSVNGSPGHGHGNGNGGDGCSTRRGSPNMKPHLEA